MKSKRRIMSIALALALAVSTIPCALALENPALSDASPLEYEINTEAETQETDCYWVANNMELKGAIVYNFALHLSDAIAADAGAYVEITTVGDDGYVSSRQVPVAGAKTATVFGVAAHIFPQGISAQDMDDNTVIKLYDGEGRQVALDNANFEGGYMRSVYEYLDSIVRNDANSEAKRDFAEATKIFNQCADMFFNEIALPEETTVDVLSPDAIDAKYDKSVTGDLVTFRFGRMQLGSMTNLQLLFDLNGQDINDLSASLEVVFSDARTPATWEVAIEPYSSTQFIVTVKDISAQDLDDVFAITVTNGTDSTVIQYSPFTYMKSVLGQSEPAYGIKELLSSMVQYNAAAEVLLNSAS